MARPSLSTLRELSGLMLASVILISCTGGDNEPTSDLSSNVVNADLNEPESPDVEQSAADPSPMEDEPTGDLVVAVQSNPDTAPTSATSTAPETPTDPDMSTTGSTTTSTTTTSTTKPKTNSSTSSSDGSPSSRSDSKNNATTTTTASTIPTPTTAVTKPTSTTGSKPRPVGERFATLAPGSRLPSGAECSERVRSAPETRPGNARFNQTRGSDSHDEFARVDGNFTGTTDEILQWVACKWGIDENIVRAQAVIESWWDMNTGGDRTGDQSACHPDLRRPSGDCPESIGLLQVRYLYHGDAFEDSNAIRSTAYNADYTYAVWRECFEGRLDWLNDVERGRDYRGGDADGCLGVWFSGRWYTEPAVDYITRLNEIKANRTWESSDFLGYS